MRLVTIRRVRVERRAADLKPKHTDCQTNKRDVEIVLPDCGAEDDEAERHEDRRQRAEIETIFGLAVVLVPPRHMQHHVVGGAASEAFTQHGTDDEGDAETGADGTGGERVEVRVDCCERDGREDVDECPREGVVPEGEGDGRVFEHVEGLEEVGGTELVTWYC